MSENHLLPESGISHLCFHSQNTNAMIFKNKRIFTVGLPLFVTAAFISLTIYLFVNEQKDMNTLFPGGMLIFCSAASLLLFLKSLFTYEKLVLNKNTMTAAYSFQSLKRRVNRAVNFSDFAYVSRKLETDSDLDKNWNFYLVTKNDERIPIYKGVATYNQRQTDKARIFADNVAHFLNIEHKEETEN